MKLAKEHERLIREAVARGEAAQDNRELHWHVGRDLLAEIDRLRAAACVAIDACPWSCTAESYCGRCKPLLDTLLDTSGGQ